MRGLKVIWAVPEKHIMNFFGLTLYLINLVKSTVVYKNQNKIYIDTL